MYRSACVIMFTCLIAVGCAESGPTSPSPAAGQDEVLVKPSGSADLAGVWDWSETTVIKATELAASFFGLTPEGPVTHIECTSSGELTLAQNGDEFTGTATQSSLCQTAGGVVFDPFPVFPDAWAMEGALRGRSMSFTIGAGLFPCQYRGSASVADGMVHQLRATGSCDVPKEIGNDKILGFVATRQ